MDRGERVARAYLAAVVLVQAVVSGAPGGGWGAYLVAAQGVAALALCLPLVTPAPTVVLRGLSLVPAVAACIAWAVASAPLGTVVWAAWGLLIVWLCLPAGPRSASTLAERFTRTPQETR